MTPPALPQAALDLLANDAKIGLLATIDAAGRPHLSLLTSLAGRDPHTLMYGQFCEGLSKRLPRDEPRTAWLAMGRDRRAWRGAATWREARTTGPEVDAYNRKPLFRYNSYFGIHTVHLLDVAGPALSERVALPPLVVGGLLARAGATLAGREPEPALRPWGRALLNALDAVKFLAWVTPGGHPGIVPAVGASTADGRGVAVVDAVHGAELRAIPAGSSVALLVLNPRLESVHLRGAWQPRRGVGRLGRGFVRLDEVYNSMPPQQGVVWPEPPLAAVTEFAPH